MKVIKTIFEILLQVLSLSNWKEIFSLYKNRKNIETRNELNVRQLSQLKQINEIKIKYFLKEVKKNITVISNERLKENLHRKKKIK